MIVGSKEEDKETDDALLAAAAPLLLVLPDDETLSCLSRDESKMSELSVVAVWAECVGVGVVLSWLCG